MSVPPNQMPNTMQHAFRMPVELYNRLGEMGVLPKQIELVRGIVIAKMSKSPLHALLAGEIGEILGRIVPAGHVLRKEDPLNLRDSVPEPDISVVEGERKDFRSRHPSTARLVVEVAVSTVEEDREMAALYAEAGIEEYWIVLANAGRIEVRRRPFAGAYMECHEYGSGEIIECSSLAGVSVAVDAVFASTQG